jgi:tetratricopeptide (TPR) repeat protein
MIASSLPRYPIRVNGRPGKMLLGQLIACALLLVSSCPPVLSQGSYNSGRWTGISGTNDPRFGGLTELTRELDQRNSTVVLSNQRPPDTCLLEPYPGLSRTASVQSLKVPGKAQNEYQKACTALAARRFTESEKHLRKALLRNSFDANGWVMLGRVLEAEEQFDQASEACSQAVVRDPSYWPAHLCLAEIDGYKQKWTDSLAKSDLAVSLNLESKRFAYYVSAVALFNLGQLRNAESRALEGVRLDRDHKVPPLQLILAKIDTAKGDISGAVMQLREYLKYAKGSTEAGLAKEELARLESKPK